MTDQDLPVQLKRRLYDRLEQYRNAVKTKMPQRIIDDFERSLDEMSAICKARGITVSEFTDYCETFGTEIELEQLANDIRCKCYYWHLYRLESTVAVFDLDRYIDGLYEFCGCDRYNCGTFCEKYSVITEEQEHRFAELSQDEIEREIADL